MANLFQLLYLSPCVAMYDTWTRIMNAYKGTSFKLLGYTLESSRRIKRDVLNNIHVSCNTYILVEFIRGYYRVQSILNQLDNDRDAHDYQSYQLVSLIIFLITAEGTVTIFILSQLQFPVQSTKCSLSFTGLIIDESQDQSID